MLQATCVDCTMTTAMDVTSKMMGVTHLGLFPNPEAAKDNLEII
jgi:hypothetical protein